ncbi:hypothetical protein QQS21_011702 [Conoideocrella luteorostrata]|uniref:NADP-dependent oxidoreductase domain-containing protein n=1 Tax=Conoideocrella luteorostrata TaxID=1105319 RepID=A0AAJ0CCP3_9HYPO|nr:hypothetical protein QQS21_011702 [Conoideocrella luteorostrata]
MNVATRRVCAAMPLPTGQRTAQRLVNLSLQQQRYQSTGIRRFKLNTGAEIPAIGFGTFHGEGDVAGAVAQNIKAGLRLVDTARVYHVEKEVGEGLKQSGFPREEIFLEGAENISQEMQAGKMIRGETHFVDTWKAMEKILKTGKTKALGISNFSKAELELLMKETNVVPAVHQMEVHPYLQQKDFNAWLRSKGIHVIQFSPLGNMNRFYRETGWSKDISHMMRVIDHPVLKDIGKKYGKSAVQVALAWVVNNGRSVIPMTTIDWMMRENAEADFGLSSEDMKAIGELDLKARFNDPSLDYQWQLYSDLDGIEGRQDGKTH